MIFYQEHRRHCNIFLDLSFGESFSDFSVCFLEEISQKDGDCRRRALARSKSHEATLITANQLDRKLITFVQTDYSISKFIDDWSIVTLLNEASPFFFLNKYTVCHASWFWCAWEIHLFQRRESWMIQGGFMLLVEFTISWRGNFAGAAYFTFNPLLNSICSSWNLDAIRFSKVFLILVEKQACCWLRTSFVFILVDADAEGTLLRSGLPFLWMEDSNTLCYRVAPRRTTRLCGSNENYRRQ